MLSLHKKIQYLHCLYCGHHGNQKRNLFFVKSYHVKYKLFHLFPGEAIHSKICRNYPFTENFLIRKSSRKSCNSRGSTHFIVTNLVFLWNQLLQKGGTTKFREIYFRSNLKCIWLNILIIYSVNLLTQSKCGKIRTRKTPNTETFYVVNGMKFANKLVHSVFFVKILFSVIFYLLQKSFHLSFKNERIFLEIFFSVSSWVNWSQPHVFLLVETTKMLYAKSKWCI